MFCLSNNIQAKLNPRRATIEHFPWGHIVSYWKKKQFPHREKRIFFAFLLPRGLEAICKALARATNPLHWPCRSNYNDLQNRALHHQLSFLSFLSWLFLTRTTWSLTSIYGQLKTFCVYPVKDVGCWPWTTGFTFQQKCGWHSPLTIDYHGLSLCSTTQRSLMISIRSISSTKSNYVISLSSRCWRL